MTNKRLTTTRAVGMCIFLHVSRTALWPSSQLLGIFPGPMSEKEQPSNPLNRRKPENRWRRILRDAEWDQNETVRRWLKLAHKVFDKEKVFDKDKDVFEKDKDQQHRDAA